MYSADKIRWIKNVKRDQGNNWAYDKEQCGKSFLLHWSTSKKGSAATPRVGDIIVLFQKPNIVNGRKNKNVHCTHLVSPISKDTLEDKLRPDYRWCREVALIAMASPIESIPNPGHYNFFLPNRGLTNPIHNLKSRKGLTEEQIQDDIWLLFQRHICPGVSTESTQFQIPIGEYGEIEGDLVIIEHIRYEIKRRNSRIVEEKKNDALKKSNGRIRCECCSFDFMERYGEIGKGFIECHHKTHIAEGERRTQLEDLALVCSNCHRMLHRRRMDNTYYSTEELRLIIMNT